jgi:hypothetical protein
MMMREPTMNPWDHDSNVTAPGDVGFKISESVVLLISKNVRLYQDYQVTAKTAQVQDISSTVGV